MTKLSASEILCVEVCQCAVRQGEALLANIVHIYLHILSLSLMLEGEEDDSLKRLD